MLPVFGEGQATDSVALETPVQCQAREVRNRGQSTQGQSSGGSSVMPPKGPGAEHRCTSSGPTRTQNGGTAYATWQPVQDCCCRAVAELCRLCGCAIAHCKAAIVRVLRGVCTPSVGAEVRPGNTPPLPAATYPAVSRLGQHHISEYLCRTLKSSRYSEWLRSAVI